ncbi:MAG: hypothetical protein K8R25_01935 [Methanosarcinales archaeon]|nr:hypothetical protein [Methanosarcinales archaeon]
MSSIMNPNNILAALNSLKSELPLLTGKEGWKTINYEFDTLKLELQDCNDPEESDRLASELIDLLIPYKDARDRLREEIRLQYIQTVLRDTIETDLPAFAAKIGVDNKIVEPSAAVVLKSIVVDLDQEESGVRLIKIKEGGMGEGKTVKIRNFHLDLVSMTELIASSIITVTDPLVVVAGVLHIIGILTKAITIQLSEQETSVFWGLVLAQKADSTPKEDLIMKHTNNERVKNGRFPLTNERVRDALLRLEKLKSVELVEGKQDTWRIVEKYAIK